MDWMEQIPCTKCMIAGNHDVSIHRKLMKRSDIERRGIIYLEHESREINGLNIFGSPYTPNYSSTHDAFTYKRHKGQSLWQSIPDNTDILVTHGPPKTVLDLNLDLERRKSNELVEFTGCKALLNRVHEVKPKIHAFGHIHEQSGRKLIEGDVTFLNCCISNHSWKKIFNGHIESIC